MSFDYVSRVAVYFSGAVILTTIQAQDFSDVDGDAAAGRLTLPIYAPELSRLITLIILPLWSAGLSQYWRIGRVAATITTLLGCIVGVRFYKWLTTDSDKLSYLVFNVSPSCTHDTSHVETTAV